MKRRASRLLLSVTPGLMLSMLAAGPSASADVVADRMAIRYVTAETGGSARPRFLSEREVAFFARVEALFEQLSLEPGDYPERFVRAATDRLVARSMLSSLLAQRDVEVSDLGQLVLEARADLELRVGGAEALAAAMKSEGLEERELRGFLTHQVRAERWVDRFIAPISAVTEDSLREAFRSSAHPFRGGKFDDVRAKLRRWLVTERFRAAELEFLQGVRARIRVTVVEPPLVTR